MPDDVSRLPDDVKSLALKKTGGSGGGAGMEHNGQRNRGKESGMDAAKHSDALTADLKEQILNYRARISVMEDNEAKTMYEMVDQVDDLSGARALVRMQ